MNRPTELELKALADAAQSRLTERRDAITELYENQQQLLAAGSPSCWFDAQLKATSLAFYTAVKLTSMNFSCSKTVLEFHGKMWGPGIGGIYTFGGGYTDRDPDWLVGKKINFELIYAAAGPSGVQMAMMYEGSIVAAFDAVGGGIGVAGGYGDGTFKKVKH